MRLLILGITLIVIGLLLSFTGIVPLGGALTYVGWIVLAIGVVLAILHFVMGPRGTVIDRRRGSL